MKFIIGALVTLLLIVSCQPSKKDKDANNLYFHNLTEEISVIINKGDLIDQKAEFRVIYVREANKYKKTRDKKYLISSKYVQMYELYQEPVKQLPVLYDMLKLSNGEYDYITILCNLALALRFESNSPELSFRYLSEAIKVDEEGGHEYLLPHLYHARGRWYYQRKQYAEALRYFDKALKIYTKKDNRLYMASMHNNFGLTYNEMGKTNMAIKEAVVAIGILENKAHRNQEDNYYLNYFKARLGKYMEIVKDYKKAEELFLEEWEFCKNSPLHYFNAIEATQNLWEVYKKTGQIHKIQPQVSFLLQLEPKLKDTYQKIMIFNIAEKYYCSINDFKNLNDTSRTLLQLNEQHDKESERNMAIISDQLNNYTIKNINQKYDYQITSQKKKNLIVLILAAASIIILVIIMISLRNRRKKEKQLAEKERQLLENNRKILEQDLELHKNKINNLHLNLNLKVETEKAFLENLKKIKKSKNMDMEEVLKDLFFKINNLIEIDNGSNELIDESSKENKLFLDKLSTRFPFLTQQDKKFCVYFKLNLSSKEVSLLENIKDASARVYKTRIKTKMGLDRDTDLYTFLNSF
ncbi:tetratricopeptide repeat protein [Chryseobacterium sp. Tr-659]|uniref:tetratricopeptide repeat protein n=1 Tax=Chryseobacterium sp. Tr-659 TaxID=2608340 RepID=UPI001421D78D|nr:tetratricopeptide repeat protein [Chryseobacterium sp. Tr-659]NIF06806.1 tetratricopeptide repeat protein [Chryseobacterium sp. Tr-659]